MDPGDVREVGRAWTADPRLVDDVLAAVRPGCYPATAARTEVTPLETPVSEQPPREPRPHDRAPKRSSRTPRALAARWLVLPWLLVAQGCVVRVYQPMSGLHRAVVVDPQLPNFADTRLDVHCVPGGLLNEAQASALCQKVGALFENQGAQVRTHISAGRDEDEAFEEAGDEVPVEGEVAMAPRTELTLELRAREVHESKHPLSWVLCIGSFTVLPGVLESTFAQDLVVRDANGFLLVSDSLEGRLVHRFGAGPWLGNAIFDLWRDDADKITGPRAEKELSADLYRQLSQIVFNAKIQAQVLQPTVPLLRPDEQP